MDMEQAFSISASGLDAQRARLNVISSNLANVESTQTPEGGPYRRKDVVFSAAPTGSFEEALRSSLDGNPPGVSVTQVIQVNRPF